jgi:hypothetical protein
MLLKALGSEGQPLVKGSSKIRLRYGLYVPNFGKASYAASLADLASEAERSRWDGFFLWDHIREWDQRVPLCDSYTALAAIAMKTKRIRIGTTVTPLPRLKPWVVARQTASLDHLSNGRLILGVGLGGEESVGYEKFGEPSESQVLAEKLDESLSIITGLWSGKAFSFQGKHYRIERTAFLPTPMQKPRIPIWVGGFWPKRTPFRRAAKWDGAVPLLVPGRPVKPDDLHDVLTYINSQRTVADPFDAAVIGWTVSNDPKKNAQKIAPYFEAGMTWWLESLYTKRDSPEDMRARIRKGPPRILM